jgi:hypothetical protein
MTRKFGVAIIQRLRVLMPEVEASNLFVVARRRNIPLFKGFREQLPN